MGHQIRKKIKNINNMKNKFKYHNVEWDGKKVDRMWNYFTKVQKNQSKWFSELMSSGIINYSNKVLKPNKNVKILDYGAGKGFLIDHLIAKKFSNSDVGEFSKEGLNALNTKFNNSSVKCFDLSETPSGIVDESYDLVFLIEVVEHLDDHYLNKTVEECYRILKPGGSIIVTTPFNEDLEANNVCCPDCGAIFHRVQHVRSWTFKSIAKEMKPFKPTHIHNTNFFIYKSDLSIKRKISNLIKRFFFYKWVKRPHLIYIGKK